MSLMHRRVLISISYDRWNNTRDIMKKVFMSFRKRWPVLVSEIRDPELSCTDYMRFFSFLSLCGSSNSYLGFSTSGLVSVAEAIISNTAIKSRRRK